MRGQTTFAIAASARLLLLHNRAIRREECCLLLFIICEKVVRIFRFSVHCGTVTHVKSESLHRSRCGVEGKWIFSRVSLQQVCRRLDQKGGKGDCGSCGSRYGGLPGSRGKRELTCSDVRDRHGGVGTLSRLYTIRIQRGRVSRLIRGDWCNR